MPRKTSIWHPTLTVWLSMTDFAAEYQSLVSRREGIVSRIAVLGANEERKRIEREQIHGDLIAAGVEPPVGS